MRLFEAEISEKSLSQWIIKGDLDKVKNYFTTNPNEIKNKLPYDQDLVTFSIYADQKEIFDWLLANGAKAGADKKGFTPLHQAALNPNPYYVTELVKFGLNINRSNKKTSSPLVDVIEFVHKLQSGVGGAVNKEGKLKKANELLDTFKELIKQGANVHIMDKDNDEIFIQTVKYGLTPFVKAMMDVDNAVLFQHIGMNSVLDIALINFYSDIVDLIIEKGIKFRLENAIRFITTVSDINVAMKVYELVADSITANNFKLEQMMYVQNGEEKMLELFKRGAAIYPSFIKDKRIQEIADKLMQTNRMSELSDLAVEENIMMFVDPDLKELFVF